MQKLTLTHTNIRINTSTRIVDFGEVPQSSIFVEGSVEVQYLFLPKQPGTYSRNIILQGGVRFIGRGLVLQGPIESEILLSTEADDAQSEIQILALAKDAHRIRVEAVAKVDRPYRHVSTRVEQTNILLSEEAIIQAVPRLEIATDDIEGGHACRVHRLSGETLFYLTSRGLSEGHAEAMLLNSEILRHLDIISDEGEKHAYCFDIHQALKK